MRNDCWRVVILASVTLFYFTIGDVKGETQGNDTNVTREEIDDLRSNLKNVLHFIDELSESIAGTNKTTAEKGRSGIPPHGKLGRHMYSDVSVVQSIAKKAAKAVKQSLEATLKTQKGIKRISKGLVQLKKCLKTFEKTVKL